jgi:DNA-binding NarL/FixJ family response regulator
MKVFLVEDSDLLRERLTRDLSNLKKIEVCGFSDSAEQAIQQIEQTRPDVIMLDIRLREGNGFHVLRAVKKPGQPPVVIVLTNFAYPQYRKKFLDAGADYFFDKSSEFAQAILVLEQLQVTDGRSRRTTRKKGMR